MHGTFPPAVANFSPNLKPQNSGKWEKQLQNRQNRISGKAQSTLNVMLSPYLMLIVTFESVRKSSAHPNLENGHKKEEDFRRQITNALPVYVCFTSLYWLYVTRATMTALELKPSVSQMPLCHKANFMLKSLTLREVRIKFCFF
jgi:hypothetical protein